MAVEAQSDVEVVQNDTRVQVPSYARQFQPITSKGGINHAVGSLLQEVPPTDAEIHVIRFPNATGNCRVSLGSFAFSLSSQVYLRRAPRNDVQHTTCTQQLHGTPCA